jgi:peptidoglycan/xylan/chitin deacetylase (PgdA/CDA1 family)
LRPTFVLSLDEELFWGSFDHTPAPRFDLENPDIRGAVRALLDLLDEFAIPATWAVVGHLFLGSCTRDSDGRAHPDLERPHYRWYPRDWFDHDPCTDRARDPLWYGDDMIDMIASRGIEHEIGCHSFSHLIYGDPGCSAAAAASDLRACLDSARARGLTLRSFVFPRNVEGHHELLREFGFVSFRGDDPTWFRTLPGPARRAGHFVDQAAALAPPVSHPYERLPGLWNLPGSMVLLNRRGARRGIPFAARAHKIQAGLTRAVRERALFHLWFHSQNLCHDRAGLLGVLRSAFAEAARLRDRGMLDIRTMGDLTDLLRAGSS